MRDRHNPPGGDIAKKILTGFFEQLGSYPLWTNRTEYTPLFGNWKARQVDLITNKRDQWNTTAGEGWHMPIKEGNAVPVRRMEQKHCVDFAKRVSFICLFAPDEMISIATTSKLGYCRMASSQSSKYDNLSVY